MNQAVPGFAVDSYPALAYDVLPRCGDERQALEPAYHTPPPAGPSYRHGGFESHPPVPTTLPQPSFTPPCSVSSRCTSQYV